MDPHPVWHALQQHILKSMPEYVALFALFVVAVIANMPHPDVVSAWITTPSTAWNKFKAMVAIWYKWLYDSLQAFMASRHPPATSSSTVVETTNGGTLAPSTTRVETNNSQSEAKE